MNVINVNVFSITAYWCKQKCLQNHMLCNTHSQLMIYYCVTLVLIN